MSIADLYRTGGGIGAISPREKPPANGPEKNPAGAKSEFQNLLQQETVQKPNSELNLSQHAETRIRSRSITWDASIAKRVSGGIDQAQAKGSRETLILADDLAVIANVKSRTVITAMDKSQLKEKIFTNIDSAVLV